MIAGITMPLREEHLGGENYLVRKHRVPGTKGLQPPPWCVFKIGATMTVAGCSYFIVQPSLRFQWERDIITQQRNNNLIVLKENGNSFRINIGQT